MKIFSFLLLLAIAAAAGAQSPYQPQMAVDPPNPNSVQPFRLNFTTWCRTLDPANAELVREEKILRVMVDDGGCILIHPVPQDAPYFVDVAPLEPGTYIVELAYRGEDYEGEYFARFPLTVAPVTAKVQQNRFELNATWRTATGETGPAQLVQAPSQDSALFYFFNRGNWELMVKVLDGCAINGHYWVFAAASTDVQYEVEVKDHATARTYSFGNRLGERAAAVAELNAFPCS